MSMLASREERRASSSSDWGDEVMFLCVCLAGGFWRWCVSLVNAALPALPKVRGYVETGVCTLESR